VPPGGSVRDNSRLADLLRAGPLQHRWPRCATRWRGRRRAQASTDRGKVSRNRGKRAEGSEEKNAVCRCWRTGGFQSTRTRLINKVGVWCTLRPMPTVLRDGPYRMFFYSADRGEPPHVHVVREAKEAKFWLNPVRLEDQS